MGRKKKYADNFTDDDEALLAELGVETEAKQDQTYTAKQERIIAGFEDVQRFYREHNRVPQHGDPRVRIAGAKRDPTYLLAEAELVATYKLANINRNSLESLLHKFFARARLDVALADRFGSKVQPREWFLVPLPVIAEVVDRIKDGTISKYRYDTGSATLQMLKQTGK